MQVWGGVFLAGAVRPRRLSLIVVMMLVVTQLVLVSPPAKAVEDASTTGFATESGLVSDTEISFVDPVQQIWRTAGSTGGTFRLRYRGDETSELLYNATAQQVEDALNALPYLAADEDGPVSVTGSGVSGDEWEVTFADLEVNRLGKLNGIIANFENLTGTNPVYLTVDANKDLPIDPSGIAYLGGGNLAFVDDVIKARPAPVNNGNVNLWWIGTDAEPVTVDFNFTAALTADQPSGLAYDQANDRLYVSERGASRIWQMDADGGSPVSFNSITAFGVSNPKDVAWDPVARELFILGGNGLITIVSVGNNGLQASDDLVGTIDLSGIANSMSGLDGLGYRVDSRTLLVTDVLGPEQIYEVTRSGRLVRSVTVPQISTPSDVTIAPGHDWPGDSLFISDKHITGGPMANETVAQDGRMWEVNVPFTNLKPYVNAGPLSKNGVQGNPVNLSGDTYDDDQSEPAPAVQWTKRSGPGSANFANPSVLSTNVTFSLAGTYVIRLTSTDTTDKSNYDEITVYVTDGTNKVPTVNAGPDRTITLPATASLAGSASDDGLPNPPGVLTTTWSRVSGPGSVTFANASKPATTAAFSTAGSYTLKLTADDGQVPVSDFVTVTVNAAPSGGNGTFIDDDGSTFEADIEWMAASGITKGCNPPTNDRFCPDDYVTRGQMAAFMVRALGYTAGAGANLFIDDNGHTFEGDIDRLGTAGVTKGCNPPTNSRYCPDDFVTRGQMAAFMVRAFGYTKGLGANLFIDDNGSTFEADIDRLGTAGVTKGCNPPTNSRYCPDEFVTRGQMAAFMHRALGD